MEDGSPIWGLILFLILIAVDALLYGFGAAIQSVNVLSLIHIFMVPHRVW